MSKMLHVALLGNPNTGKSSVFNQLTGLNQKVGNYPGITVERKEGVCKLSGNIKAHISDLPGTYSLNATSLDEQLVVELLLDEKADTFPDVVVVVADIESLKRNLLLFTQIKDLNVPVILAVNMIDVMDKKGISLDIEQLEKELQTKIALVSARKGTGFKYLKELILNYKDIPTGSIVDFSKIDTEYFENLKNGSPKDNTYKYWLSITQDTSFKVPAEIEIKKQDEALKKSDSELKRMQQKETILRYLFINKILKQSYSRDINKATDLRSKLDKILTHRILGYVIFMLIILLIFQAIYNWSEYPMDFIDNMFASFSHWIKNSLPSGVFSDLISEGVIPGIGGIVIFIPQIAFLFLFISILEETGYMSRVVFIMDKFMRRFGLSGKGVVPLISGTACAIPAIMSTRTIENWKERLITILVTPFTTCSARLPVYLIIIAMVIPNQAFMGLNLQGLTLMALYMLGFGMAVFSAYILNKILKTKNKTFFVAEMPDYKMPLVKNVAITVYEKTKDFVVNAGKIIFAISIILWFLASHGTSEQFRNAESIVTAQYENVQANPDEIETMIASHKLRHSFIGTLGRAIEPAIQPLGYDWKIGIALLTSFVAREVFVSSIATIYSVGSEDEDTIKNRLAGEINVTTGKKAFNFASGISLLLFYAFAMQCMSTLAVVKRETNSWKWPMLQLFSMTAFAYVVSLIAYQFLQ